MLTAQGLVVWNATNALVLFQRTISKTNHACVSGVLSVLKKLDLLMALEMMQHSVKISRSFRLRTDSSGFVVSVRSLKNSLYRAIPSFSLAMLRCPAFSCLSVPFAHASSNISALKTRVIAKAAPAWQRVQASPRFQQVNRSGLWSRPWLGWAFVYAFSLLVFGIYRCSSLRELLALYATPEGGTFAVVLGVLTLGFLEDLVCITYFACALWLFDWLKLTISKATMVQRLWKRNGLMSRCCLASVTTGSIATFTVSWLLFMAMLAPVVADLLIVHIRGMRFDLDLVSMAIEEKAHISAAPISREEVNKGYVSLATLVIVAKLFAFVRTKASWADLTGWNPTSKLSAIILLQMGYTVNAERRAKVAPNGALNEGHSQLEVDFTAETGEAEYPDGNEDSEALLAPSKTRRLDSRPTGRRVLVQTALLFTGLVFFPAIVVAISSYSSPLVACAALNASLNELFCHALEPTLPSPVLSLGDAWAGFYIHNATEKHTLFGADTLYRRTTGFQGDLAFDVAMDAENPPNVLVIVVESFQFHDSRYLVGESDPSNLFNGTNMTATPHFDTWGKRGVALRNLWSSVRTSRSLESILFAQVPYDSAVHTGTSGGRRDTALAGLPQLFTAKGYETFFTTGATIDYDGWEVFLPSHGFDTVWSEVEMKKLAESSLGIKPEDWKGDAARAMHWGVHDDVSFQLLGDLLVNKTQEQRQRVAHGKPKKPLFLTHYTISSHGPYQERPKWYAEAEKPDFFALYDGATNPQLRKDYLEMRYFSDVELGKFMDRLAAEGVLNDTVVVITGDHGTGADASTTRVAGAVIAEGRLGKAAGLVVNDAAEHYDLLNTLADITGVPSGGFLQDGVGRSLKRKASLGERLVFSNDPNRKMAIVRGHERLRYDRISDAVFLHNTDTDHQGTTDLFPVLSPDEQTRWMEWRDRGRQISAYYTHRWDNKCLLAVKC